MIRRRGITLIELLIVIAILSVLAAFLLPTLGRAVKTARSVACASQQKKIYLGFVTFRDENNGCMPPKFGEHVGMYMAIIPDRRPVWGWHDFVMYEVHEPFREAVDANGYVGFPFLRDPASGSNNLSGSWVQKWWIFSESYPSHRAAYSGNPGGSVVRDWHWKSVFHCPESNHDNGNSFDYNLPGNTIEEYLPWRTDGSAARKWQRVQNPAGKIFFSDAGTALTGDKWSKIKSREIDPYAVGPHDEGGQTLCPNSAAHGSFSNYNITRRHQTSEVGGSNYLYLDGHVHFVTGPDLPGSEFMHASGEACPFQWW